MVMDGSAVNQAVGAAAVNQAVDKHRDRWGDPSAFQLFFIIVIIAYYYRRQQPPPAARVLLFYD